MPTSPQRTGATDPTVAASEVASEPTWPQGGQGPVVFLLDAASGLEERILRQWAATARPDEVSATDVDCVVMASTRRRRRRGDGRLEDVLAAGGDPLLAPLRVAWMAARYDGVRRVGLPDLLTLSDPRDPRLLRQHWTLRRHPGRCRVVAGLPAPLSDLRARWRDNGGLDVSDTTGLGDFVARQAVLALERAERQLRGARYKVPRLVTEDILGRPAYRGGVARLARGSGEDPDRAMVKSGRYLREIAATHSSFVIDLVAQAIRLLYTRGYGEALHYDHERLEEIYSLAQRHPVVFLPSHKSNLDHLVLQYALHEHGHPPNHTAGGINMNFFPVGPLLRRAGVFFIRRTFKDNDLYKFVLRSYVDYLIEKRFSMEWYVEGGRSRSGKLLPPRFGLLSYVVDSLRRARSDDVMLIPVSIAYDQIQDVGDYVSEQRGGAKATESFGWFVGVIRRLGGHYGGIHIRFGDPLSLRDAAIGMVDEAEEEEEEEDGHAVALQKIAFEVCVRINRVTPITPTSLVALALLGVGDRALTVDEAIAAMRNLVESVTRRGLPVTEPLDLDDPGAVRVVLDQLVRNGVVACYDEGPDTVYAIGPDQHLAAAYYRNTILHFFTDGSILELALLSAAREGVADREAAFWQAAFGLRDLFKFEFFFADKARFRSDLESELDRHAEDWRGRLSQDREAVLDLVRTIRPFNSHRVLRPFLESYQVVGDVLERWGTATPVEEGKLLGRCLALGKQYRLQRRITRAESVSKVLFATALRLARNRGLLEGLPAEVTAGRAEFAAHIRETLRDVEVIDALATARRLSRRIEGTAAAPATPTSASA